MSGLPKLFHVQHGETLLAVLEACKPSDYEMFWLICDFKPTAAFAGTEVESLFHQATDTEDVETIDAALDRIIEMGVRLVDVESSVEIKYFTLYIYDDVVHLRYAEPPYIDE